MGDLNRQQFCVAMDEAVLDLAVYRPEADESASDEMFVARAGMAQLVEATTEAMRDFAAMAQLVEATTEAMWDADAMDAAMDSKAAPSGDEGGK